MSFPRSNQYAYAAEERNVVLIAAICRLRQCAFLRQRALGMTIDRYVKQQNLLSVLLLALLTTGKQLNKQRMQKDSES